MGAREIATSDAVKRIDAYLMARGIRREMVREIRRVYADRAIQDGSDLIYNRIYTAIGVTCVRHLGFGAKRTADFMWAFDKICDMASKSDDPAYWSHLMEELYNKTNIIVRTGSDETFNEFASDDEIAEYNRLIEEKRKKGLKAEKLTRNF